MPGYTAKHRAGGQLLPCALATSALVPMLAMVFLGAISLRQSDLADPTYFHQPEQRGASAPTSRPGSQPPGANLDRPASTASPTTVTEVVRMNPRPAFTTTPAPQRARVSRKRGPSVSRTTTPVSPPKSALPTTRSPDEPNPTVSRPTTPEPTNPTPTTPTPTAPTTPTPTTPEPTRSGDVGPLPVASESPHP